MTEQQDLLIHPIENTLWYLTETQNKAVNASSRHVGQPETQSIIKCPPAGRDKGSCCAAAMKKKDLTWQTKLDTLSDQTSNSSRPADGPGTRHVMLNKDTVSVSNSCRSGCFAFHTFVLLNLCFMLRLWTRGTNTMTNTTSQTCEYCINTHWVYPLIMVVPIKHLWINKQGALFFISRWINNSNYHQEVTDGIIQQNKLKH